MKCVTYLKYTIIWSYTSWITIGKNIDENSFHKSKFLTLCLSILMIAICLHLLSAIEKLANLKFVYSWILSWHLNFRNWGARIKFWNYCFIKIAVLKVQKQIAITKFWFYHFSPCVPNFCSAKNFFKTKILNFGSASPYFLNTKIKNKNVASPGIEPARKNKKRIARTHDPMFTLSQNGYGTYYVF